MATTPSVDPKKKVLELLQDIELEHVIWLQGYKFEWVEENRHAQAVLEQQGDFEPARQFADRCSEFYWRIDFKHNFLTASGLSQYLNTHIPRVA